MDLGALQMSSTHAYQQPLQRQRQWKTERLVPAPWAVWTTHRPQPCTAVSRCKHQRQEHAISGCAAAFPARNTLVPSVSHGSAPARSRCKGGADACSRTPTSRLVRAFDSLPSTSTQCAVRSPAGDAEYEAITYTAAQLTGSFSGQLDTRDVSSATQPQESDARRGTATAFHNSQDTSLATSDMLLGQGPSRPASSTAAAVLTARPERRSVEPSPQPQPQLASLLDAPPQPQLPLQPLFPRGGDSSDDDASYTPYPSALPPPQTSSEGPQGLADSAYQPVSQSDMLAGTDAATSRFRRPLPAVAEPFVLVPVDASRYPILCAHTGAPLAPADATAVPLVGPWVLTNAPAAFPSADAVVRYRTGPAHAEARLAIRLQYVPQRVQGSNVGDSLRLDGQESLQGVNGPSFADPASQQTHAELHLFNISRRRRGHEEEAAVFVMSSAQPEQSQGPGPQSAPQAGQAGHLGQGHSEGATQAIIRPGDRGLPLQAGDIIVLGTAHSAPRYRVERWAGSAAGLEQAGLGSAAQAQALHTAPLAAALARHATATPPPAAAAPSLQALAQLARTAPQEADAEYRRACTGAQRHNAFAWIAWAQLCARRGQPRRARDLFRAAVAAAQAAASTSPHPTQSPSTPTSPTYSQTPESLHTHIPQTPLSDQPQAQHTHTDSHSHTQTHSYTDNSEPGSSGLHGVPYWYQDKEGCVPMYSVPVSGNEGEVVALVQSLYTWARFEWGQKGMRGAARHLWRAAADVAHWHPRGVHAGGLGFILHTWALAEYEQDNVYNAQVVVAQGLRKCPYDAQLFVAAASIELKGGNAELARDFCLRAYELSRTDKQLYVVWPRVMAALGEREKARVLFERGLEYHPRNTKIMSAYAAFEAETGDPDSAIDLYERAMSIDSQSFTAMKYRTALARLEADRGRFNAARRLLEDGLDSYPTHTPALIELARTQRLAGQLIDAQATLRLAQKFTHAFYMDLIRERAMLYTALGQRQLAAATKAHLRDVVRTINAKRRGVQTTDAYLAYIASTRTVERQALARAARQKKVELGWVTVAAPGVPGPRAARRGARGVPWVPLPAPPGWVPPGQALASDAQSSPDTHDSALDNTTVAQAALVKGSNPTNTNSRKNRQYNDSGADTDIDTPLIEEDTPSPVLPEIDVDIRDEYDDDST